MTDNGAIPGASTGSLKMKLNLLQGKSQNSYPFYGMKELPPASSTLGSQDLLSVYDLTSAFNRFCGPRKLREDLPSFLPHLVGDLNLNSDIDKSSSSSLKSLIEKPPITGKEINPLSASAMTGFRLQPGAVPEQYRVFQSSKDPRELQALGLLDVNGMNGTESEEARRRKKMKRTLEDGDGMGSDGEERKFKRHKSEAKEKKEKKKKKDKKKKKGDDESRKHRKSQEMSPSAFNMQL
uniref:Mediator of RNA polymerase II transcription subunit 19 n=1 Tax=Steinernema glaseri TaxID=37863 RepID=A0A1I7ZGA2_9BILA